MFTDEEQHKNALLLKSSHRRHQYCRTS